MLQPFTLIFGEDALEHGLIYRLDKHPLGAPTGRWACFNIEPDAWGDVLVFSDDFPTGISLMALIENMKRTRGIVP